MRYNANAAAGFTLIELLIVIVIIGILAAIAIPQYSIAKQRAFIASMQSDLRNLAAAEAGYFATNQTYAGAGDLSAREFRSSQGVTITIDSASATGWGAHATHTSVVEVCRVSVSQTSSLAPACETP